jgi:hypothetical protein
MLAPESTIFELGERSIEDLVSERAMCPSSCPGHLQNLWMCLRGDGVPNSTAKVPVYAFDGLEQSKLFSRSVVNER